MRVPVRAGNVYVTQVPDGRYVAVRILRVIEKTWLVDTSEYLERDRPSLDDPRLRRSVAQNRFKYRGNFARLWLDGRPPGNFELLGCIPPTEVEAALECNVYGGKWSAFTGHEAYLEWRWLHDREALEEEYRQRVAESERRRRLPQKPRRMLDEDTFWSIIALLDWSQEGNDERVLAPAIEALTQMSTLDIRRFEERLAYLLYQIDTAAHASNSLGPDSSDPHQVSPDAFLYARCVVVANGREFYEAVLRDPTRMPRQLEFEPLLTIAAAAYERKTGNDFDYSTGCSYESFSNADGWPT